MASPDEIHELLHQPLRLGSGRRAAQLNVAFAGELSVEELLLASTGANPGQPQTLAAIRQSHHQVARLLAKGCGTNEVSEITGFTPSRISTLKGDPAFAELLAYYTAMDKEQFTLANADMHKRLSSVGFDSLEILHERLLESPESFDNKTLLLVVEATADRTGHGKTSTVNHEHAHSLSSQSIAELKAVVNSGRQLAPADRSALLLLASDRTADEHPEAEEAHWVEGGGGGVREEGGEASPPPLSECDAPLP